MRALVTGAGGFLGGRLAQMLAGRNVPVTVLAKAGADLGHLGSIPVRVVRGSATEFAGLRDAVRGCTHIFHCPAGRGEQPPERTSFEIDVLGTGMLLEAANREPRLRRFVHISSTDVYGYPKLPVEEDAELVDAGSPLNRTKLQAETAVWGYADLGLPVTVLRPATVYGPGGSDAVVDTVRALRQRRLLLVDGGRAHGGFCYVDNLVCAAISAAAIEKTVGQAYNLADGAGVTWREYIRLLAEGLGLPEPRFDLPFGLAMAAARISEAAHAALPLPGAPLLTRQTVYLLGRDREFPSGKAARDFGYAPGVGLVEGMRRTLGWVRSVDQLRWADSETTFLPAK